MLHLVVNSLHTLTWGGKTYPCLTGRGGISAHKREGDGATPVGNFPIRQFYWRADRVSFPDIAIPATPLSPQDGWCDDPVDSHYNQWVRLPFSAHHEVLWRKDTAYDIIGVLGYNDDPPLPGHGSAIFLHVWRQGATHTDGCIALRIDDLLEVIGGMDTTTHVVVESQ